MQINYRKISVSFFLLLCLVFITSCDSKNISKEKLAKLQKQGYHTISIKDKDVKLEIASDQKSRTQGLSDRESLCENCGMLFVFDEKGQYDFWMKDMKFPLDIVYLEGNKVIEIFKNVQALDGDKKTTIISPKFQANRVLEFNAGYIDKLGVKEGEVLTF